MLVERVDRKRPALLSGLLVPILLSLAGCGSGSAKPSQAPTAPSNLAYPATKITATVGQAISSDVPTISGAVDSYSVSPALPAGLNLSVSTGAISGTPTAASAQTTYTVTAQNAAGSTTTTLQITVSIAAPSNLAYPTTNISAIVGQAIPSDVPTVSGTVDSYSVSPALPAGLNLSTTTGAISGTPTASAAQTSYTVTAQNASGSTSTTLQITVNPAPPSALVYPQPSIVASVNAEIMPDIPTVVGTVSTFSVSPALPPGLSLNPSTGVISGAPTTAAAQILCTVTAENSGGSTTAAVTISVVAQNSLLDLGHASAINAIRMSGDRMLTVDESGHWVLWSYSSGVVLAEGDGIQSQHSLQSRGGFSSQVDMAGVIFLVAIPNGIEIRSTSDGHLLSIIISASLNLTNTAAWWQLASDGSYVSIGTKTGLTAYAPTGAVLMSKSGDYSLAATFSAPGNVEVALGPAGQSVIENISVAEGTSTVSPPFSGQFDSWFLDGSRFLSSEQNTVWVYSNRAAQQAIVTLPSVGNLTGQGNWIWTYAGDVPGYPLDIYAIGSETPALSYSGSVDAIAVPSGNTIGLFTYGTAQLSVFDLSGSMPSRADYSDPVAYLSSYAAESSNSWAIGNIHGALIDGASLAATPRYFGYGQAWSIAGTSGSAAVSTASGKILIIDPSVPAVQQAIRFSSSKVSLSADGTVLGAMANANDAQYETDRTLNFYSLPSGALTQSYPSSFENGPTLFDFTLADSGVTVARSMGTWQPGWAYAREVTALNGNPVLWSDSPTTLGPGAPATVPSILLSPDGTLIDVYEGGSDNASFATNILKNGQLITAIPGVALGWLDNNRILVNQYSSSVIGPQYSKAVIYDSTGVQVATSALPELKNIQSVTSDSVYDRSRNAIYSLSTGQPTWTGTLSSSGVGAVAGSYVVYESGHKIVAETF